jgi:hypothetical protein
VSWRHLPASARTIAVAASQAVTAATEQDRDGLATAVAALTTADGAGLVLGAVVRLLLEDLHPDGLDGDDVRQVLTDTVLEAAAWQPEIDPHTMLVLLAGALGVYDRDEEEQQPDPAELARHAALLVAHLLAGAGRPLAGYLGAAFTEIQRTELQD